MAMLVSNNLLELVVLTNQLCETLNAAVRANEANAAFLTECGIRHGCP